MSISAGEEFNKAFKRMCNGLGEVVTAYCEAVKALAKGIAEMADTNRAFLQLAYTSQLIKSYPNRRIAHLALCGKKARTRKKNINRIKKDRERVKRANSAANKRRKESGNE